MTKNLVLGLLFLATILIAQTEAIKDSFPPALDLTAWSYIDTAMIFSGMTRTDTEFEKKWAGDTLFRLTIVDRLLDHPLEIADTIDSWTHFLLRNPVDLLKIETWEFNRIDCKINKKKIDEIRGKIKKIAQSDSTGRELPAKYSSALRTTLASFDIASDHMAKMMDKVSDESLDSLLFLLPTFWTDEDDSLVDSLRCYFLNLLGHDCDTSLEIHLDSLYITMHNFGSDRIRLRDPRGFYRSWRRHRDY